MFLKTIFKDEDDKSLNVDSGEEDDEDDEDEDDEEDDSVDPVIIFFLIWQI